MVYVKYIKRGGKKYGPYYYQSIRDSNGNIKNLYVGKVKKEKASRKNKNNKKINYELILFIFFVLLSITTLYYVGNESYTGFVTLQKSTELVNMRSVNTQFINNSDGTQTAIVNAAPMFSKENNMKAVENVIKRENTNEYSIDNGLYKAYFSDNIKNGIKFQAYENYLTYKPTNLFLDNETLSVNDASGVVDNTKVSYYNIFDNVDLEYEAQLKQLKENFIIKNPIEVNDSLVIEGIIEIPDWQNIVVYDALINYDDNSVEKSSTNKEFTVQNSKKRYERLGKSYKELSLNSKQFSSLDNKNIRYIESNEIDFLNKNKETLFYIKEPYAKDANNEIIKLNYTILLNNSKIYLILKIPGEWLKDKKYPIVIDPTDTLDDPWSSAGGKDTIISSDGYTNGNSGGATFLYIGNDGTRTYRSLIQFDLSSLPNTASVSQALLKLYYYDQDGNTLSNVSVYRLNQSWTEGSDTNVSIVAVSDGATWNQYSHNSNSGLNQWITAGGDYNETISARTQLNAVADNAYVEWDITTLVRNLGAGNHTKLYDNYGVILIADDESVINGKYFYSSDYGTTHLRPKLEVTYTLGSESPSITINSASQNMDSSGNITIGYTLTDAQNDTCNLTNIQYSNDGGSSWYTANNVYGSKNNINSNDTGINYNLTWSSKTDLSEIVSSSIKFRFRANDSVNVGAYGTSSLFTIDNKPPVLTNDFLDDGSGKNVSDADSIVRIGAYVNDDYPNVIKYELGNNLSDYSNPGSNYTNIVNDGTNLHSYTGLTLNIGDILYYRITVNDTSGNTNVLTGNKTILNQIPYFTTLPNNTVAEDTMPSSNWIDLWAYIVDDKNNASQLNYSIGYQSNSSLINCSINGNRYVDCGMPAANMSGISNVRVNITDTSFNNGTGVTTVNVTPVNDLPWWNATIQNRTIWENEPLNISLDLRNYAGDVERNTLYFEIMEENLSAVDCGVSGNNLTLLPAGNFTGSVNCTIRVNDTEAGGLINVTIDVLWINQIPWIHPIIPNQTTLEDTILTLNLTDYAHDVEDMNNNLTNRQALNWTTTGYNLSLVTITIDNSTDVVTFEPAANQSGETTINFTLTDTAGAKASQNITFNITPVNDLPWWNHTIANQTIWEDEPLNITNVTLKRYAYDIEHDLLYFEIVEENLSAVDCGTTNITSGNLTLTPYANFTGSVNCTIRVNDTEAGGLINITIDVLSVNDAPYWLAFNITALHDLGLNSTYNLSDYARDVENKSTDLIYSVVDKNINRVNCGINADGNHLDFTPAQYNYSNIFDANCTIQASDGIDATNYTIWFNITNVLPNVTLNSPANASTDDDGTVIFNCSANDVDGDLFNITFYNDLDGVWGPKYSVNFSGINNESTYTVTDIAEGVDVKWNCRVYDTAKAFNFYPENWTFNVSLGKPIVQLIHPFNDSVWSISNSVNFTYNVTSNVNNSINNCSLIINNNINVTSYNLTRIINQTFNVTLPNSVYNWSVNCTDNISREGYSRTWNLTVNYTVPTISSPSSGGGGGGGGRKVRERIASLEIIVPSIISILSTDTTIVPITIRNNGDVDLTGISMSTESNAQNLSMKLSEDKIPFLRAGQYENLDLTLSSYELSQGRYTIKVMAKVDDPRLSKYTTLYLDVVLELLIQESVIKSKIDLTKEFFNKNKECSVFNDMIVQAEDYFYNKKYAEASSTIDLALQSCKDLLAKKEKIEKSQLNWWLIGIIGILVLFIIFISYRIYKTVHKEEPIIKEGKISLREVQSRYDELEQINNLLPRLEYLINTRDFRGAEVLYNDIMSLYDKLNNKDKRKIYHQILALHKKAQQDIYKP
ncbi:MAG: tandem-95 repeat protein [Candidatus Woesearchaeota archaeon]|nr:tandem-95 repeat protein [Candidatus Woesearchaeota archaeon]